MRLPRHSRSRPGITLLEVIVATAIFLFAMGALLKLSGLAGDEAVAVRQKTHATELALSKMSEVVAGITPLSSADAQPFEDPDADYQWSLTANSSGNTSGLYAVTVTVSHPRPSGSTPMQVSVSRMVLTPSYRGNITVPAAPPIDSNTQASSSSNSSSSSSSNTPAASAPATTGRGQTTGRGTTSGGTRGGTAGGGTRGGTGAGGGARGGAGGTGGRGTGGANTGGRGGNAGGTAGTGRGR